MHVEMITHVPLDLQLTTRKTGAFDIPISRISKQQRWRLFQFYGVNFNNSTDIYWSDDS